MAGWITLNADPTTKPDIVCDLSALESLSSEENDVIYLSHVLEHITLQQLPSTLSNLHRMLTASGTLMISVPDLTVLMKLLDSDALAINQKIHIARMIFGGNVSPFDFHYFGFNEELLRHFLTQTGFTLVRRVRSFHMFSDTSEFQPYFNLPISLNMVAHK